MVLTLNILYTPHLYFTVKIAKVKSVTCLAQIFTFHVTKHVRVARVTSPPQQIYDGAFLGK